MIASLAIYAVSSHQFLSCLCPAVKLFSRKKISYMNDISFWPAALTLLVTTTELPTPCAPRAAPRSPAMLSVTELGTQSVLRDAEYYSRTTVWSAISKFDAYLTTSYTSHRQPIFAPNYLGNDAFSDCLLTDSVPNWLFRDDHKHACRHIQTNLSLSHNWAIKAGKWQQS